MLKDLGKHSNRNVTVKQLKIEIEELNKTIKLKDREIEDVKLECAKEFKQIADLCFCNEYDGKLDKSKKLSKISEIASDNCSILMNDLEIENSLVKNVKIIELSRTCKSNR